ncbi:hypothetical protein LLEC1_03842 [Akanthomyces lecanii]|uniref:Aminopeptidase n=1 Tax=Cordyceps confragosa TaxID=2714763 RepID=A0A179I4A6_CORDF|nr:hypothetical protein LLEC1_03842 [Akanthomyces lecanii]
MRLPHRAQVLFNLLACCVVQCRATASTIATDAALNGLSAQGRLPSYVKPYHYDLVMEPIFSNVTFRGHVLIDLQVIENADVITLHSRDLNITSALVHIHNDSEIPSIASHGESETLSFKVPTPLKPGTNASIELAFVGTLRDDISGFLRASFTRPDGSTGFTATTHMEPTYARRAFPCFDEPALKASFAITLVSDDDLTCVSNMHVAATYDVSSTGTKKKAVRFHQTPVMSTYLVVFAVGELSYIENKESRIPIRVYVSPENNARHGTYAADVLARSLAFYEDLFDVSYPLPKLDVFAPPTFMGAMENWGLIIGNAGDLMYDPTTDGVHKKQRVTEMMMHELAHQWFGNLVTLDWWDQTWLNEGGSQLEPYWKTAPFNSIWSPNGPFKKDAYRTSRAVQAPVSAPNDITDMFDPISYVKGGTVLKTVQEQLTPRTFFAGISRYLKTYAYGNTKTEDLWDALSDVSGQDVSALMQPWIKTPGYPFLKVTEGSDGIIHIEQHRFLLTGDITPEEDETLWPVALNIKTPQQVKRSILRDRNMSIHIQDDDFYILNANYTGLFRTHYPVKRLRKLSQAAQKGLVSGDERAGLISDTCALAEAGYHRVSTCLDVIMSLQEENLVPWQAVSLSFDSILSTWTDNDAISAALESTYSRLAGDISRRIGWDFSSGGDGNQQLFRIKMFVEAAKSGDRDAVKLANDLFRKVVDDGEDIEPNVHRQAFATALYHGGEREYEDILRYATTTRSESNRGVALRALLDTEDTQLIHRTLDAIIDGKYSPVDMNYILAGVGHSRNARLAVWPWAQKHWTQLKAAMPQGLGYTAELAVAITRHMTTQKELQELEMFMEGQDIRGLEPEFALSAERLRGVVAWIERDTKDLENWLELDDQLEL